MGIDPAGVGHSTPQLRCRTDAEFDAYRAEPMADYSPAGVAHIEELYQQFAAECLDRMGADFLANIGTASAARDMDVVRAALGEDQINYLGFSYGTELGSAYADRYPDRVRAMVLDGAVDPSLDPIAENIRQMAGFQRAFDNYAADCAQSAGCPLGTDPAQFVSRYHQLVDPLVTRPAADLRPARPGLPGCDHRHCQCALLPALLDIPDQRPAGTAARHRSRRSAVCWPTTTSSRDRTGHYTNQQDAFTAIRCVDAVYPTDPAVWADADQARPAGGAVPVLRRVHRLRPARRLRDVASAADVDAAARDLTRSRQGRRGVHDARSGHAVSGRRRPGRTDGRVADHLRRHPAHGGVQRRRVRRHRRRASSSSTRVATPAGLRC